MTGTREEEPEHKPADERFREISFELQTLAQSYINSGQDSPELRNAIQGIIMLADGMLLVLRTALQPRS